jgi:hypothetical protein
MLTLLLLFPAFLAAQAADSTEVINRFQLGLVFGQMDHEVSFTPSETVTAIRGSELGVALRYFDNKLVGFQAELSYVEAGWGEEEIDTASTGLYERKTQYLEFQILTQFSFGRGAIQPMLQAGPYFSFPLNEQETLPSDYVAPETSLPLIYGFEFPFRPNYGLRIGAGLNIELGPVTVQLDGRYLIGFNDLLKTGTTFTATSRRAGIGGHTGLFYAF